MQIFGLIGHPLSHSFSKRFFEEKFLKEKLSEHSYELFDLETIEDVITLKETLPNLRGLNVTIPYKTSIMNFVDEVNETARLVGAVNTIKIVNGKWIGYNTDVIGLAETIKPLLVKAHNSALILGTGGASKAVQFTLKSLAVPYITVSREPKMNELSYQMLDQKLLSNHNLIINTTPLGMYPDVNKMPLIPFPFITSSHSFYDLIYNPEETLLLKKAKNLGCIAKNGLEMLHIQAEWSWKLWNDL